MATHVLDEVDNLADDLLATLETDLAGNNALKAAFESDATLLDTWKNIKFAVNSKKHLEFLSIYEQIKFDKDLQVHVFDGVVVKGTGKGGHATDAIGNTIRFSDGNIDITRFPKNTNGVIKVEAVDVEIKKELLQPGGLRYDPPQYRWFKKRIDPSENHTFFPKSWDRERILEEFASAYTNPNKTNWNGKSNAFQAQSESGVTIIWYEDSGKITSFFPKY